MGSVNESKGFERQTIVPYNPLGPMLENREENEIASSSLLVGERLRSRGLKLATAESCTAGLLGDAITSAPGSSEYYLGGVIAYAYEAKTELLGISQEFLLAHGAVSEETARAMASGIRARLRSDIAVALTGILGPGGGMPNKPVGLVYIALLAPDADLCRQFLWKGDRRRNKLESVKAALKMLLEYGG